MKINDLNLFLNFYKDLIASIQSLALQFVDHCGTKSNKENVCIILVVTNLKEIFFKSQTFFKIY